MRAAMRWVMLHVRLYRLDGNPLRRRSDRIEALGLAFALVLFTAGLVAAPMLGGALYEQSRAEVETGRWVTATVTKTAATARPVPEGSVSPVWTAARWAGPDGRVVTGQVPVRLGAEAGTAVRVWFDGSGQPSERPRQQAELVAQGVAAGLAVALLTGLVALLFAAVLRHVLDRRRYAAWDAEWALTDQRRHRPKQT
jgi:hypothetical protein